MKRLLSIMGGVGLIFFTSSNAISCGFKISNNNSSKNTDNNKSDDGFDYGEVKPGVPSSEDDNLDPGSGGIKDEDDETKTSKEKFILNKNKGNIYVDTFSLEQIALIDNYAKIQNYPNSIPKKVIFDNEEDKEKVTIKIEKDIIKAKVRKELDTKTILPIKFSLSCVDGSKASFTLNVQAKQVDLNELQNKTKVNFFVGEYDEYNQPKNIGYDSNYFGDINNFDYKKFLNKYIEFNGISILDEDVITQIVENETYNKGKNLEIVIAAKPNQEVQRLKPNSALKLSINSNVDPIDYFAKDEIEVNVFRGTYEEISKKGIKTGDEQGIKALIFEQLMSGNTPYKFLHKLSSDKYAKMTTRLLSSAKLEKTENTKGKIILDMSQFDNVFKGNLTINYKLIEETRISLFEEVYDSKNKKYKKYDIDEAILKNPDEAKIKEAKKQIYNKFSSNFRERVSLEEFTEFTRFSKQKKETGFEKIFKKQFSEYWAGYGKFNGDQEYKLEVLPGSKVLYGHYAKTFWNYINTYDTKNDKGKWEVVVKDQISGLVNQDKWVKQGGGTSGSDFYGYEGGFNDEYTEGLGWWTKSLSNEDQEPKEDNGCVQTGEYNEGFPILKINYLIKQY
ncbi:hypothetical protein SGLAD_v1c01640 [Spiroplasma gladiatoris]|uniref:Lipoprotein n=1 Tax=Spiroplasma gladiatoris TaxID=2143 RepID=A0A4P7AI53_9MOLU|nr:lipoprotein [Spiroplasma gladiatoris]QBQ07363.1 hypothetical protein SGLAD_v1c01640 [Spiroplasma gladiatoris]